MTDDAHPYRTEPDPAFADRLEGALVSRFAVPANSTGVVADPEGPEDVQVVRMVGADQPAVGNERHRPGPPPRSRSARWLAAAAVVVLVGAAVALVRNAGDDSDGPVAVDPTTVTAPAPTDTPSTGSIVTADGHGWPEGAVAPMRPDSPNDPYDWADVDPPTGSFLYVEYLLGGRVWVLSEGGDEQATFACPLSNCWGSVFGPGSDEVTALVLDETCTGPTTCDHGAVVPERVQILAWDGTARDSVDISAAFTHDGDGTAERSLAGLAWSPDGSRLAVVTQAEGGDEEANCEPFGDDCGVEVWIIDPDGDEPQLVHTADPAGGEQGERPVLADLAWSPDGRSLAVSLASPPVGLPTWPQLVALRFEPGEPVWADVLHVYDDVAPAGAEIFSSQYGQFALAWSPDGSRIAVTSDGGVAELSSDDGRVLARHPGDAGVYDVYGLAWLPED